MLEVLFISATKGTSGAGAVRSGKGFGPKDNVQAVLWRSLCYKIGTHTFSIDQVRTNIIVTLQ
jgi:hypothetical protein